MVIGVVAVGSTVASREHKYRAKPMAPVFDALAQGLVGKGQGCAVEVVAKRVRRAPAVVADIKLVLQTQRLGDLIPTPLDPGRNDLCIRRDADDAGFVILSTHNDARDCRAVEVAHRAGRIGNLVLAILRVRDGVKRQAKVDLSLQVRMCGVDTIINHAHRDARAADLSVELVQAQRRQVPLRRLQRVGHAAVELTQTQGVSTEFGAVRADVKVVGAISRRRNQQTRIKPGTRVVVLHQFRTRGIKQAQRSVLQGTTSGAAAARAVCQHVNHIHLACCQSGTDPVLVTGVVDTPRNRRTRQYADARARVAADVVRAGRTAITQARFKLIGSEVARHIGGTHGQVVAPAAEHRYGQVSAARAAVKGSDRDQGTIGIEQAQSRLRQRAQTIAKTLDRKVVKITNGEVDSEQVGVGGAVNAPRNRVVAGQHTMRGVVVTTRQVRPVIQGATTQVHHAHFVLPGLRCIQGIHGDAHTPTAVGRERGSIEQRGFSHRLCRSHIQRCATGWRERQRHGSRCQRCVGAIAHRQRFQTVLVTGLQIDREMIGVASQTNFGHSFGLRHRAGRGKAQTHCSTGIFVCGITGRDPHRVSAGSAGAVNHARKVGSGGTGLEGCGRAAVVGFHTITNGKHAACAIHHLHQRPAQRRASGGSHGYRQHFVGAGTELEPVFVGVGCNTDRVVDPHAESAVAPLDVASQRHIACKRGGSGHGVAVVIRRARHQGIAAGVGLTVGSLHHQVVSAGGVGRKCGCRLVRNDAVVYGLHQSAVAGANLQHRVEQTAVTALGGTHAKYIVLLTGERNPEPVLVVMRQQLPGEGITRVKHHPRAQVVGHVIGRHVALYSRYLVGAHAAFVVGRSLEVVGAGDGRRKVQHGIRAGAAAIGKVKQMPSGIKHPQIRVGQRTVVAGQPLGTQLIHAAR